VKKNHWAFVWGFVGGTFLGGVVIGFVRNLAGKA
jgi:glycerol uptake facilitator-like aquaporin